MGLLSFSDKVTWHAKPTSELDAFEGTLDETRSSGMTAIFLAVVEASRMLKPMAQQHPGAALRVLVLSDGQNNCTEVGADGALRSLAELGVVCGCIKATEAASCI